MIKLGILGSGTWGINHIKTAYNLLGKDLIAVGDTSPAAGNKVKEVSPDIFFTTDIQSIFDNPAINGMIIATPASTHYELTKKALLSGKHVLVEKPITLYTHEAKELIKISDSIKKILMVGHVLLYHPAITKMKELIDGGKIGKLQYIYSNRLNLGTVRSEENILWSFAPHDISIIQYLTGSNPVEIDSHGARFIQNSIEDTTITYLKYLNNIHAHIFVSWLHPFKEQRLVVVGDKGMLVFEDSIAKEKLKFYPKGFHKTDNGVQKFEGEFESIHFSEAQPLAEEHKHFYESIIHNHQPLTDGKHALEVLEILEQATRRLKS
jgi:UDP-2-acetamido-3-amino-2,3-dideoxy-glucuronate N-acetyltransferase